MFKIKDITLMAMMLALLLTMKLIQTLIPDLPNGLGDVVVLSELVIITFSLFLKPTRIFFVVAIYAFGIVWINPGIFIAGITYVSGAKEIAGVYFLDYVIPLFLLATPALFKSNWMKIISFITAVAIGYISHVLAGVIFWGSYSWSGWSVWTYSIVANMIKTGVILVVGIIVLLSLSKSRKHIIVQDGYVNDSFKVKIDGKYYQKRVPKFSVADWVNEKKVYENLGYEIDYKEDGVFYKPWIKGSIVKRWTPKKIESLKQAINKFHNENSKGVVKHDWNAYDEYKENISKEMFSEFNKNIKEINKLKTCLSHNDINGRNVLWSDKKIILIDFEWARINNIYFDYAQFEIAEGISILPIDMDKPKYDLVFRTSLIYFYLWTFSMEDSKKLLNLRKKYQKMLDIKN